jgi:hypothetical protein
MGHFFSKKAYLRPMDVQIAIYFGFADDICKK